MTAPLNLLMVDDDRLLAQSWRRHFEMEGWGLSVAATLASAERMLATATLSLDVVLLDLKLPDGHGSALLPSLRWRAPEAGVVIVSGTYEAGETVPLLGKCDAILPKPVSTSVLLETITWASRNPDRGKRTIEAFAAKFRLTKAETWLLLVRVGIATVDAAEWIRPAAPSSFPTLWQRIFKRTGVRSQADVLALLVRFMLDRDDAS